MKKISAKQQAILDFIEEYTRDHGYPPSVREIGAAVNLRSPSTVHTHLKTLSERGLIVKDEHKTRAISFPGRSITRGVPILGRVTAGTPIFAFEEDRGEITYMPEQPGDYFALEISGDSMINAGILDGDYVVVNKQNTARHGQIVVALLEDEATCKRLHRENGEIWLMPENPAYDPINGRDCTILGLVVSVVRETVY